MPKRTELLLHNQGGGSASLGIPVDDETDALGAGYAYTWSPLATNGTWAMNVGNGWGVVGTLDAGEYEAVGEWSSLEGCPVNGDWSLAICDMMMLDNGYVFEWTGPLDVTQDFELCDGEFTASTEASSTYCTNDDPSLAPLIFVPDSDITAELTFESEIVETVEVTEISVLRDWKTGCITFHL